MVRFQDRVCVVNGAASLIGEAVTERLQSEGAVVIGVDLHDHDVGDTSLMVDLQAEQQVVDLYAEVVARLGRLDVVYNNQGLMNPADLSLLQTDLETWRAVQDANLTTTFLSCKHAVPHFLADES